MIRAAISLCVVLLMAFPVLGQNRGGINNGGFNSGGLNTGNTNAGNTGFGGTQTGTSGTGLRGSGFGRNTQTGTGANQNTSGQAGSGLGGRSANGNGGFGSGFSFDPSFGPTPFGSFSDGNNGNGMNRMGMMGMGMMGLGMGGMGMGMGMGMGGMGMGGMGMGRSRMGGFGMQQQTKVRPTVRLGFEVDRPSGEQRAQTAQVTLSRLPQAERFAGVSLQMEGSRAIVSGRLKEPKDAELLRQLLLLEPGIYEVDFQQLNSAAERSETDGSDDSSRLQRQPSDAETVPSGEIVPQP